MENKQLDNLITCPKCKVVESCYVVAINEFHNSYTCLNCGFKTNDLMVEGEFDTDEYEEVMPELYKEIKYKDEQNRFWYPFVINIENKGTVFANGVSADAWYWSAIKSIPLTDEEKVSPKFKGKLFKSDSKTLKDFGMDYFKACEYINFFTE